MSRLPNFFLVGAPKSGTTALYHYLDQHPQIYMSPLKEPNYFAAEVREENYEPKLRAGLARQNRRLRQFLLGPMLKKRFGGIVADWDDYLRLFANVSDQTAVGEASVCYLWSPSAPARIAQIIPDAKILVMLRNPADRAFSQYLHGLGNGVIHWSFREHIERSLRHRSGQFCVYYPFLQFGLYSEQIVRYRERFGANIWIGLYEDFKDHPLEVFRNICRFLGVAPGFSPDMTSRHLEPQVPRLAALSWLKRAGVWTAAAGAMPAPLRPILRRSLIRERGTIVMDPADREYLLEFYREDIAKLTSLLGSSLTPHWSDSISC